ESGHPEGPRLVHYTELVCRDYDHILDRARDGQLFEEVDRLLVETKDRMAIKRCFDLCRVMGDLGKPELGLSLIRKAIELARQFDDIDPHVEAILLFTLAELQTNSGDRTEAIESARKARRIWMSEEGRQANVWRVTDWLVRNDAEFDPTC